MASSTSSRAAALLLAASTALAHGGVYRVPEAFPPDPDPAGPPLGPPRGLLEARARQAPTQGAEPWKLWWNAEREVRRVTRHPAVEAPEPDIGERAPVDPLSPTAEERAAVLDALWDLTSAEGTAPPLARAAVLALARSGDARVREHLSEVREERDGADRRVALLAGAWCAAPSWLARTQAALRDPALPVETRHLAGLLLVSHEPQWLQRALDELPQESRPAFTDSLRFAAALERADRIDRDFAISIENPNRRRVVFEGLASDTRWPEALAPWTHGVAAPGSLHGPARGKLHDFLAGPIPERRLGALLVLARRGPTPTAIERVQEGLELDRPEASLALALMLASGGEWPEALGSRGGAVALLSPTTEAGALALGLSGSKDAWQRLAQHLRAPGPHLPAVLAGLSQLQPPASFLTSDEERALWRSLVLAQEADVASAAAYACGQLQLRALGGELIEALAATRSEGHALEVVRAIGALGDRRFVAPLLERLTDEEAATPLRVRAAVALGALLDPRTRAWSSWLHARGLVPLQPWWRELVLVGGF